ncbi:MAG: hypothetical protein QHH80_02300 [Anaerolineae bacterium]|nr:hypothetical protein [Anaerolineae bacterium]
MALEDRIHDYVRKLPLAFQQEVLDFIQYLLTKAEQQDRQEWSSLALAFAMRGMEDEETEYALSDLKVVFR